MTDKVKPTWFVAAPLGALVLAVVAAPRAIAQESPDPELILEEVVVTAQKREESLQDVPLSVEAIAGDKLTDAGILRMDDLKYMCRICR
jgi:outer membrane receptor protein involved in Fe transport